MNTKILPFSFKDFESFLFEIGFLKFHELILEQINLRQ